MAYLRGELVALLVEDELTRRTEGARSLDDIMRALARRGRSGERVTMELLLDALSDGAPAFRERLRAIVEGGAPIEPPTSLLGGCLASSWSNGRPRLRVEDRARCAEAL